MDSTLIATKSGAKYAKDANDWIFWHNESVVPNKLQEFVK